MEENQDGKTSENKKEISSDNNLESGDTEVREIMDAEREGNVTNETASEQSVVKSKVDKEPSDDIVRNKNTVEECEIEKIDCADGPEKSETKNDWCNIESNGMNKDVTGIVNPAAEFDITEISKETSDGSPENEDKKKKPKKSFVILEDENFGAVKRTDYFKSLLIFIRLMPTTFDHLSDILVLISLWKKGLWAYFIIGFAIDMLPGKTIFCQIINYKTAVINDPLGQTHSLANSEHCFHLKFVLLS